MTESPTAGRGQSRSPTRSPSILWITPTLLYRCCSFAKLLSQLTMLLLRKVIITVNHAAPSQSYYHWQLPPFQHDDSPESMLRNISKTLYQDIAEPEAFNAQSIFSSFGDQQGKWLSVRLSSFFLFFSFFIIVVELYKVVVKSCIEL